MNRIDRNDRINPPAWMERLLRMLLPAYNRETIAGDLREEFHERAESRGAGPAKLWYLRQTISFAPRGLRTVFSDGPTLILLCAFTGLCGLWLGAMDLRLRHPGYAGQLGIAGSIVSQALVTIAALHLRYKALRYLAMMGCVTMFWLSGKAFVGVLRGYDFEGYILLIAVLLAVQSALTLFTLPWIRSPRRGTSA
ncbi:MAG TPA: permease prefix domain 2-containing transporter [Acidobacteriaceae bacterium]